MCASVRIIFNSNNQIGSQSQQTPSACTVQFSKETQSADGGFSAFSLIWKPLPSIRFNWKVMKFLFKEMTQVYEDHLPGETGLSYLGWVLCEGRVCISSNWKCLVLSQCYCMKLHGFYISCTIWVLLPQRLVSQADMVSFATEVRRGHFTQQTLCFYVRQLKCTAHGSNHTQLSCMPVKCKAAFRYML